MGGFLYKTYNAYYLLLVAADTDIYWKHAKQTKDCGLNGVFVCADPITTIESTSTCCRPSLAASRRRLCPVYHEPWRRRTNKTIQGFAVWFNSKGISIKCYLHLVKDNLNGLG
jgi:hypothetical protein